MHKSFTLKPPSTMSALQQELKPLAQASQLPCNQKSHPSGVDYEQSCWLSLFEEKERKQQDARGNYLKHLMKDNIAIRLPHLVEILFLQRIRTSAGHTKDCMKLETGMTSQVRAGRPQLSMNKKFQKSERLAENGPKCCLTVCPNSRVPQLSTWNTFTAQCCPPSLARWMHPKPHIEATKIPPS